ncbi:MAG: hypothetical protein IIY62_04485 [Kiritimatiellae bacterium]|nr:hypothetical protein [Kiritimatiellia bacterium]
MKHMIIAAAAVAMAAVVGCSDGDKPAAPEAPKAADQTTVADLKAAADKAGKDLQAAADKTAKDVDAKLKDATKTLEDLGK